MKPEFGCVLKSECIIIYWNTGHNIWIMFATEEKKIVTNFYTWLDHFDMKFHCPKFVPRLTNIWPKVGLVPGQNKDTCGAASSCMWPWDHVIMWPCDCRAWISYSLAGKCWIMMKPRIQRLVKVSRINLWFIYNQQNRSYKEYSANKKETWVVIILH